MKEIKIGSNEQGQRFDKLLAKILKEANKGFIYKMLRKKNITLNGKKATGNEILALDDVVKIFLADETFDKFAGISGDTKSCNSETMHSDSNKSLSQKKVVNKDGNIRNKKVKLDVIAETDDYILINKPVGMLSQKAEKNDISLVEYLLDYMLENNQITKEQLVTFRPGICNRLDRNTSGIVIGGKSLIGLQKMTEYIKNRDIDKYYIALVKGQVTSGSKIDGYLIKDSKTNKVKVYSLDSIKSKGKDGVNYNKNVDKGSRIETEYEPICSNESYTLLKVKLITGKTHQIRAHLASVNHPLVGDYKYGDKKVNDYFKSKYGLESQLLHAYEIIFDNKDEDIICVKGKSFKAELSNAFKRINREIFGNNKKSTPFV